MSDQEVRWCPGCGDYSILAQTQKVMPDFGFAKENIVFISGIGCSGRLPYYMNTYGFHTIHGRAPTLATGLKAARPDLMVWVITGDGDALSIGGNHVLHSMRRNVDIKLVMFNNRIYGLTKGQASPTSEFGKRTKSTPDGTIDHPIMPLSVALAAEATFVARSVDTHTEHLQHTLERAGRHNGSAFVEVLQNCNIFNDGAWRSFTDREVRDDKMLALEHGKPMIFGKDRDKGIRLRGLHPEVVQIGVDGVTEADILVHDEHAEDPYLAFMLSRMFYPEFPVPVGVIRDVSRPTHDELLTAQLGPRWSSAARATSRSCSTAAKPGRSSRRGPAMICPACGFDNIAGEDECERCGTPLTASDRPAPHSRFEARLIGGRLSGLASRTPLMVPRDLPVREAVGNDARGEGRCGAGHLSRPPRRDLHRARRAPQARRQELAGRTVGDAMTRDPVVSARGRFDRRRDQQDGRRRVPPYPARRPRRPDGHRHGTRRVPPDRRDRRLIVAGPRVVVLADDLIWSTRLLAAVRAAGAEPVAVRTLAALTATVAEALSNGRAFAIVDLTARAYDGVEAVAAASTAGADVLAVGQHDDVDLRKRALAAGASKVLAYRKLADDGPATIRAWLKAEGPSAPPRRAGVAAR